MKSLICGASGFIGSHLVKRLESEGHEVKKLSIRGRMDFDKVLESGRDEDFDYIFYLSSYGNMYFQDDDEETLWANIYGLYKMLELANDCNIKGFINFSSSSVMLPYETMYSATKGAGERIVKAFVNKYDKPVVSVRPFTVTGKGDNPDHLIPKLINSSIKGDQIPFIGSPVHDYISVNDLIDALLIIMDNAERLKGKILDIGTGKKTTNEEVFNIVRRVIGKKPNVERVERLRSYDTINWVSDPYLLKELGWKPKQSLEYVIRSMI